mmetsp:Transcript_78116/g.108040  ORF Transcript_78116/g.108040 Transcript_78116/m.108040 type:complete len:89 (+) Transcript_78116:747-1013(+)|eukprot:scaffold275992_cov27-Tisochrysis_lutea.AAC.1
MQGGRGCPPVRRHVETNCNCWTGEGAAVAATQRSSKSFVNTEPDLVAKPRTRSQMQCRWLRGDSKIRRAIVPYRIAPYIANDYRFFHP